MHKRVVGTSSYLWAVEISSVELLKFHRSSCSNELLLLLLLLLFFVVVVVMLVGLLKLFKFVSFVN